jgi:hypothetical protein
MAATLRTATGKMIEVTNLRPEDINAYDIAWALSNCNRYAGHTPVPWDVLSHTGLAYMLYVKDMKGHTDPRYSLAIMLHDAAEAYIGDMIGGLKNTEVGKLFKELEERILEVVFARFNLKLSDNPAVSDINWDIVNRYDWQAAHVEISAFFPEVASNPNCTQAQYAMGSYPTLIKAKVSDYIELLRYLAINGNVQGIDQLFSLPNDMKDRLALEQGSSMAQTTEGDVAGRTNNRDVEEMHL